MEGCTKTAVPGYSCSAGLLAHAWRLEFFPGANALIIPPRSHRRSAAPARRCIALGPRLAAAIQKPRNQAGRHRARLPQHPSRPSPQIPWVSQLQLGHWLHRERGIAHPAGERIVVELDVLCRDLQRHHADDVSVQPLSLSFFGRRRKGSGCTYMVAQIPDRPRDSRVSRIRGR